MNKDQLLPSEQAISLILSVLFSLVFKYSLTEFKDIVAGISISTNHEFAPFIFNFAMVVFVMNLFRMLHGFVISFYDQKRNPTSTGKAPFDFVELSILLSTFIIPVVSIINMRDYEGDNLIWILIFYQLPLLPYIFWDGQLHSQLNTIIKFGKKKDEKLKAKKYIGFVRTWLILDLTSFMLIAVAVGFETAGLMKEWYLYLLFTFSIANFGMIFSDYVIFNKEYYFELR